ERRRPRLGVGGGAHDAMARTELRVAELGVVGIALYGFVLPQDARDLRGLEVVARVGEAVAEAGRETGREVLPQLRGDVERVAVARIVEHVDPGAAEGGPIKRAAPGAAPRQ